MDFTELFGKTIQSTAARERDGENDEYGWLELFFDDGSTLSITPHDEIAAYDPFITIIFKDKDAPDEGMEQ